MGLTPGDAGLRSGAVKVRRARPGDTTGIERVAAAAFGEEPGGSLTVLLRALTASGAVRTSLVAVEGADVVGHLQLNRCWLDVRRRLVDVLVLSPLSVAPAHQRRGIGTALVARALAEAELAHEPAVFLEGVLGYYDRRGFQSATPLGFGRPSVRIPEPAFQVALLSAYEPWMTGRLVYCDAFWTTDSVGLRDPELAEIEERARLLDRG